MEPVLPHSVVLDRGPILRRALSRLPDAVLGAMARGLDANAERLVPGRLFASPDGGGCAVGVMLRELDPHTYRCGRLRFWLRHRWLKGVDASRATRKLVNALPRLRHVELMFDTTFDMARARRPELSGGEVARAVGLWFSAEVHAELARRARDRAHPGERRRRSAIDAQPPDGAPETWTATEGLHVTDVRAPLAR